MARHIRKRDLSPVLGAAEAWITRSLVQDQSVFSDQPLWTGPLVSEVYHAFVDHPDFGEDTFIAKLKGQLQNASAPAQQLLAEMLWALLLFPSNTKARTKRQQIREMWALSGEFLADNHPLLTDAVLVGVGSGGPGFNNYRPEELAYLITLVRDLKGRDQAERQRSLTIYDAFMQWIAGVPRDGSRQYRHMLRFFAFPDRVERMSSNNHRRKILEAYGVAPTRETKQWNDQQLDEALFTLRATLGRENPGTVLDFYEPPLKERWSEEQKVKTVDGEVTIVVPNDEEEQEEAPIPEATKVELRPSLHIQARLAEIGAIMGLKIWVPPNDRGRVRELVSNTHHAAFLEQLPLNYDNATIDTIEQIDVLWLRGRSIMRAFEVEHTTAVYSGLLRMADLLALQPNMDIRLYIVAPDERRDKVFREMRRPVFTYLERGPLSRNCAFISYESVDAIRSQEHLAHLNDSVIEEYEERADTGEA